MRRAYQQGGAEIVTREQEYYDAIAGFYDSMADEDYVQILARLPADTKADAILEIGCGSGALGLRLRDKLGTRLNVGLDVSHGLLSKHPFMPVLGNGQFLPFADESFDFGAACSSLHHIHNLEQTLRELFRVLKPGGRVLFVEPNADHPQRRLIVDGGFMRRYFLQTSDESIFPQDLLAMMRKIGFREASFKYATFRNRRPSVLGRTQSLVARLPRPRGWERYVESWFIMVGQK